MTFTVTDLEIDAAALIYRSESLYDVTDEISEDAYRSVYDTGEFILPGFSEWSATQYSRNTQEEFGKLADNREVLRWIVGTFRRGENVNASTVPYPS